MLVRTAALVLLLHASACGSTEGAAADAGGGPPDAEPPTTCSPWACSDVGAQCGVIDDGCDGIASCGSCTGDDVCGGSGSANICAACTSGAWAIEEVVHPGQAWGFAMDVDATGAVHVAYTRPDPSEVRYAKRTANGEWQTELVRPGGNLDALVTQPDGTVHIALTMDNHQLAFSHRDPAGKWTHAEHPGSQARGGVILAVDEGGNLHAAFGDDQLNYIVRAGQSWSQPAQLLAVPTGQGVLPNSLAIDSGGQVHMIAREYQNLESTELLYLRGSGDGPWPLEDLGPLAGDTGRTVTFALDADDDPHFLNGVVHHQRSDDSWSAERADPELNTGGASSMAFDSQGSLHISYSQYTTYELKHSVLAPGGTWSPSSVDDLGWVGTASAIDVDSQGGVHILYSDQGEGALRYAYRCP